MKLFLILSIFALILPTIASAADKHEHKSLKTECSTICPDATSDKETESCINSKLKDKKTEADLKKSACYKVFKNHDHHEGDKH